MGLRQLRRPTPPPPSPRAGQAPVSPVPTVWRREEIEALVRAEVAAQLERIPRTLTVILAPDPPTKGFSWFGLKTLLRAMSRARSSG